MIPKIEAHPLDEKLKHKPSWQEQMPNPEGYLHQSERDSDEDEGSEEANKFRKIFRILTVAVEKLIIV